MGHEVFLFLQGKFVIACRVGEIKWYPSTSMIAWIVKGKEPWSNGY
jgi:hypothetical protein